MIQKALQYLGKKRFVLTVHDMSFPSLPDEEMGYGSPYSKGAKAFVQFAKSLGFNAIQLGPQGRVTSAGRSPYSGTVFSRNTLSLSFWTLLENPQLEGLFVPEDFNTLVAGLPAFDTNRAHFERAWVFEKRLLDLALKRMQLLRQRNHPTAKAFIQYRQQQLTEPLGWFSRECAHDIFMQLYATDDWRSWPEADLFKSNEHAIQIQTIQRLIRVQPRLVNRFCLGQYLAATQHQIFRFFLKQQSMNVFGDVQIGFSFRDQWMWQPLFLQNYALGAPPSRSNPDGQPWGYPVLDPKCNMAAFIKNRFSKMFDEYDGLRIDHPHGLVCPWVYRTDDPDPLHAVQNGARLNCAPNLADHPNLAAYAVVDQSQLDLSQTRYADTFVQQITPVQADQFGRMLDLILELGAARGFPKSNVLCEVLSTWPAPLKAAMQRHSLGRLCVTQKADPADEKDLYRITNTCSQDWVMIGTHDTKPIWHVVDIQPDTWRASRAGLLAKHLKVAESQKAQFINRCVQDKAFLTQKLFVEMFLAPAENVSVFFPDLMGLTEIYNQPGTVGDFNWSLRVPNEFESYYHNQCQAGQAFNVAKTLAEALEIQASGVAESDLKQMAGQLSVPR